MQHIVLVGCGKMGEALLQGWLRAGYSTNNITVVEPGRFEDIQKIYQVKTVHHYQDIYETLPKHTIVFAIKPQLLEKVLPDYEVRDKINGYITIVAGKSFETYGRYLSSGKAINLIRAMPNLPATVGAGITGLCASGAVTQEQCRLAEMLFSAVGEYIWLTAEDQLNAITAISGSGPAYLFYFAECLAEAAVSLGFSEGEAVHIANATIYGSARMIQESSHLPKQLKENVKSPKGTTEAALNVLESSSGLKSLMHKAVAAAYERARELAGE